MKISKQITVQVICVAILLICSFVFMGCNSYKRDTLKNSPSNVGTNFNDSDDNSVGNSSGGSSSSSGDSSNNWWSKNKLEKAYDAVYANYSAYSACFRMSYDKSYVYVDTNPYDRNNYYNSSYLNVLQAMNKEMRFGSYLYTMMCKTSALMGMQTETNSYVKVTWTFHPDKGLEAIYVLI